MSSRHWNVEPASLELNENEIAPLTRAGGLLVMVVFGGMLSTVHAAVAGVASAWPAGSTACTLSVWLPWARPL